MGWAGGKVSLKLAKANKRISVLFDDSPLTVGTNLCAPRALSPKKRDFRKLASYVGMKMRSDGSRHTVSTRPCAHSRELQLGQIMRDGAISVGLVDRSFGRQPVPCDRHCLLQQRRAVWAGTDMLAGRMHDGLGLWCQRLKLRTGSAINDLVG